MCLLICPSFAVAFTTSFNSNHYNIIYIVINNITFKFNINNITTNTVTHRTIWNAYTICIIRYTSNTYTIQINDCIRSRIISHYYRVKSKTPTFFAMYWLLMVLAGPGLTYLNLSAENLWDYFIIVDFNKQTFFSCCIRKYKLY